MPAIAVGSANNGYRDLEDLDPNLRISIALIRDA